MWDLKQCYFALRSEIWIKLQTRTLGIYSILKQQQQQQQPAAKNGITNKYVFCVSVDRSTAAWRKAEYLVSSSFFFSIDERWYFTPRRSKKKV